MKNQFLKLFTILTAVVLFAGQARAGNSCSEVFGGASAAQHLETDPFRSHWAPILKDHIDPAYKTDWDRLFNDYHLPFHLKAKSEGSREIEILEELGFKIVGEKFEVPNFSDFLSNYEKYLDAHHIPEKKRILPAITFRNRRNPNELLLRTPGRDSWPDPQEWSAERDLRLKGRAMAESLANGRYPLFFSGGHDVFHLITFLLYPNYAEQLRNGHRELLHGKLTLAVLTRTTYALEVLALANPNLKTQLEQMIVIKHPKNSTRVGDFIAAVDRLSDEEINNRAEFWKNHFQSFLNHYAGGMAEPYERNGSAEAIKRKQSSVIRHYYEGRRVEDIRKIPIFALIDDGFTHMDVHLETLVNLKNESATSLAKLFPSQITDPHAELNRLVRLQIARLEYGLWKSTNGLKMERWMADTLVEKLDLDSQAMRFIRDVFGEQSVTYRYFSGQE